MLGRKHETQALVVGAGPVGLFTALCLTERGVAVTIVDKGWRGSVRSYALALHPGSLELLDELGVARPLLEHGQRVQRIAVYEGSERVGELDYSRLAGAFRFVLVVPQSRLEHELTVALKAHRVKILRQHDAREIQVRPAGATVRLDRLDKDSLGYPVAHTEWMVAKTFPMEASVVVGADGYHSRVRDQLDIGYEKLGKEETFIFFEFPTVLDSEHEARLVFHEGSANVFWPLGPGAGRWSFQVESSSEEKGYLQDLQRLLGTRAPWFRSSIDTITWAATTRFERRLAGRFGRDRIWLAGDAAHLTGPIGVQSMNVGLREAHDLAARLSAVLQDAASTDLLQAYDRERRRSGSCCLVAFPRPLPAHRRGLAGWHRTCWPAFPLPARTWSTCWGRSD